MRANSFTLPRKDVISTHYQSESKFLMSIDIQGLDALEKAKFWFSYLKSLDESMKKI